MSILKLSALELFQKIKTKELSSTEVTKAFLEQTKNTNKELNSFLLITETEALKTAATVDDKIAKGQALKTFEGVPIAIKDNICIEDLQCTCASKILEGFKPPYNATVIEKIKAQNMPILGKTNMDEFAMGSSTETSYYGVTRNPWDTNTVPGGSSGGSAVAVGALQAPLSLGSDTGGSIRQPASFCGIVGLKPTYGLVSRFGLIAFASSLDQIGPFAQTVEDCAQMLNIICGNDKKDSTSLPNTGSEDYVSTLNNSIKGLKVAIPEELFTNLSPEVKAEYDKVINTLSKEGVIFESIKLPSLEYALATYYIIAPAEASSNLARYDGVRFGYRAKEAKSLIEMMTRSRSEGFGAEVKRRILIGTYVLSSGYYEAYYKKAQQVRTLIKEDFAKAFAKYDVIFSPTTPTPAFGIGEKSNNPLEMYLSDVMTIPVNMAGLPGISIPCSLLNGLPLGVQLVGNLLAEKKLLNVAQMFEKIFNFKVNTNKFMSSNL